MVRSRWRAILATDATALRRRRSCQRQRSRIDRIAMRRSSARGTASGPRRDRGRRRASGGRAVGPPPGARELVQVGLAEVLCQTARSGGSLTVTEAKDQRDRGQALIEGRRPPVAAEVHSDPTTEEQEIPSRRWDVSRTKRSLGLVSGKWTLDVLAALWEGPRRPTDLRSVLPAIPERVLLSTLRTMTERGLVAREEMPAVPVSSVEYALTDSAYGLGELLERLSAAADVLAVEASGP